MKLKKTMFWIAVIITGIIVLFLSNEWNRAAFGSRGHLEQGTKFGISIGDNTENVIANLKRRGLTEYDLQNTPTIHPHGCHSRVYAESQIVQFFRDKSWRRGNICLVSEVGIIVHVSWDYGMFQP